MFTIQSVCFIVQLLMMVLNHKRHMRTLARQRRRRVQLYRRRKFFQRVFTVMNLVEMAAYPRIPRRMWTKPRSIHFWKDVILGTFSDQDWVQNFRMSKTTFEFLHTSLKTRIERKDTTFRKAISVRHRLAITIWTLATPSEYRTIAHLFGVARSTVCVIVHDTCKAIVDILFDEFITFPHGRQLEKTISGFQAKWQVPQCVGAIDGSHIPVSVPAHSHTDYYNRKGWYSVLVQAVVSYDYTITDVNIGWPGSVHDARVLVHSELYRKAISGEHLPPASAKCISGVQVPPYLIGDAAYPLKTWLMKPFPDRGLSNNEKTLNYRLSRARMVVENAFGRLKGRWRRLMKRNDMTLDNIPVIIAACCVLHNICEKNQERYDNQWSDEVAEMESAAPQPDTCASTEGQDESSATARDIRRALMMHFISNPL